MKPSVYIETTIPSYLTAWPSRDPTRATDQQATRDWWERRGVFELFVSQLVLDECRAGDPQAAADRLAVLSGLAVLGESEDVPILARALLRGASLPGRASNDALHIAIAAVEGVEYFLTWNCRHIASETFRPRIATVCRGFGYVAPQIITPRELAEQESIHDR